MQPVPSARSRQPGRVRRGETSSASGSAEQKTRITEVISLMSHEEKQEGDRGRRAERKRGGGKESERGVRGRRAESEGGEDEWRRLRGRLNQLEKEKLQLTSSFNQEVCGLQAELTRLRSSVERGEAQRAKLQYQLTASRRAAELAAELSRDRHTLTERAAELQQTVHDLQKALSIMRQARDEDQHALQQELEERDRLIQNFGSENQRLHLLLQDQERALEESETRMVEVQRKKQKEEEENGRLAEELKILKEKEEKSRREKEVSDQRMESLEAERADHMEARYKVELLQLRVRDLEVVVEVERSNQQEAQRGLELLQTQLREVERAYSLERERSDSAERAQQRLQTEFSQTKSEMTVALDTERKRTSDLSEQFEEEKKCHANTHMLLQQAAERRSSTEEALRTSMKQIRDLLQQHGHSPAAKDSGSSAEVLLLLTETLSSYRLRLEESTKQVQDQQRAAQELQEQNRLLQQLTSDQKGQAEGWRLELDQLKEEVTHLHQQRSDWLTHRQRVQEEREKEEQERKEELQKITTDFNKESTVHLSSLYALYQQLLVGRCLLSQPQSIVGDFTWKELCDVISEHVDQLTSDLQKANEQIAHLQRVCDRKSVCVRKLQHSQECVLARLEKSVRRREEAWSKKYTDTVRQLQGQLQSSLSLCDSHRDRASSLEHHCSSLTSDLSRLQSLLSRSQRESSSTSSACCLLGGALRHAHQRLSALSEQKKLLSRRLEEREGLEGEVRRLVDALGGERDKEVVEEERRRRTVRRWRRSVWVVLAMKWWCALTKKKTVLLYLDRGGGAVGVCGGLFTATQKGQKAPETAEDAEACFTRWLQSEQLFSIILSSMSDLQEALAHRGSSPPSVISAACSGLSRLLDHLLDQSAGSFSGGASEWLKLGLSGRALDLKALVSALQQHFLLFSQRLHSAEVERRSLRLEVTNLRRGLQQGVPNDHFLSVCEELHQALSREQEAQTLIQDQSKQVQTLSHSTQELSEARREVARKERSLRILGKHLSGLQKEKQQLEERLRRAEEGQRDLSRRHTCVVNCLKSAETSCKQVRESLSQSHDSISSQPRPLLLPLEHLELRGAESIMGAPEVAMCQTFLSVVSQLCHACISRIGWLEQEVSAHRSHVTALRSELQDACLRDNQAFVPVEEFPEPFPPADPETPEPVPLSGLSKGSVAYIGPAPS
nr:coiled-coil domain-containing protein 171 isoform X1 [Nothobranchius furzeri]XP_015796113.2 coiled-coil domain-containing protein 171 isoform X1 [Nothobranchius furzeri]XP_015796114.2 coiled-coil domain-containing protein 171 isoform X1 [Nothobranchius furzeri]